MDNSTEKRFSWLESPWTVAAEADTTESWHTVGMMIYGAVMASELDTMYEYMTLRDIAHQREMDAIYSGWVKSVTEIWTRYE